MEFFKKVPSIDFLGQMRAAALISAVLILGSLALLAARGLNFGIDFTGGTLVELGYPETVDLAQIRSILENSEFEGAAVQYYGTAEDVLIRLPPSKDLNSAAISGRIMELLAGGARKVEMRRVEFVGAQVGEELAEAGGLAIIYALLGILIYVALRFQMRFSVGAIGSLVHDVVVTLGFFALTQIDFNLNELAAVLTIIGYSLNDTIVIFDRVRDNFRRMRTGGTIEVFNVSMNQTLSRTIITGMTTLFVLVALLILGGELIQGFAAALIVGIIVGTYSSVYVASPIAIVLGVSRQDLLIVEKEGANLPNRP